MDARLRRVVYQSHHSRWSFSLPSTHEEINTEDAPVADDAAAAPASPLRFITRLRAFEALGQREFRLLWLGQSSTGMATWMDQVTRGWLLYQLTDSPLQLGLVRGIQAIPLLLLSPIAGTVADRYARKTQVWLAQAIDGVMHALLALLILSDAIEPWHVYATAVVMATDQTFLQPARAAMVADSVPRRYLTNAIGLNSLVFNVARSTGPALAGVLIARYGTGGTYAVQALFCLFATVWTGQLRPHFTPPAGRSALGRSILDGWQYSWRNEAVRSGLLVTMFAGLFVVPFMTLLPIFARDLLGVGASGQGFLLTAMGIGALASAFLIAWLGDRLSRGPLMLGGVALYGLSVIAFAVSPWFRLSLGLMALVGAAHVSSHALVQTVIQTYSSAEFRGRTMALFSMNQVVLTLGSLVIGSLATLWGARWAMAAMGAAGVAAMIVIMLWQPRARHIR
ncbi:MAG TPA: MFS transporter [Verrucomicrobiae bacterium]|jgi:MFS family permease|nr:MFS transporter [Verrucomicrobiae bacterium]